MPKPRYRPSSYNAFLRRSQKIADKLAREFEPIPSGLSGRGIVTCAGGYEYFPSAWVMIRMLRHLGCDLPIQLWYLGPEEVNDEMKALMAKYGVECVDGLPMIRQRSFVRSNRVKVGWVLKSIAVTRCPFEEVLFLDADNIPIRDPSFLFNIPEYKSTGALFWPDVCTFAAKAVWRVFRVAPKFEPEFESGQFVVDKRINWEAIALAERLNLNADVFYRLMWGDKDTFRFAWHKLGRTFAMTKFPPQPLRASGAKTDMLCQHDFQGTRLFQHRNMYKWNLLGENLWIPGFFFESECRAYLEELKSVWNGRFSTPKLNEKNDTLSKVDLFKKIWLLKLGKLPAMKPKGKGFSLARCSALTDNCEQWIELEFKLDGTFSKGAGREAGVFWDFKKEGAETQLILSDAKRAKVKLKQSEVGWKGVWVDGIRRGKTKMLPVEDFYSHLKTGPGEMTSGDFTIIRNCFGNEIHLVNTAAGIGDHVAAIYACAGLARTGVRVIFHSHHVEWLSRVNEPGLTITSQPPAKPVRNLEYDYQCQLRYGISRPLWYAGGLHPLLKPVVPDVDRKQSMGRLPFHRYILISPFARNPSREWIEIHWIRLANLLRLAGFEVVAVGSKEDEKRLRTAFGDTQVYWVTNHPPQWVIDSMLGAAAYVGIDSGMTHLAALMGVKVVAIHSHLEPDFLWPRGRVKSVAPQTSCVFCRWQLDKGWMGNCEKKCSALASVGPENVLRAVLEVIGNALPQKLPGSFRSVNYQLTETELTP